MAFLSLGYKRIVTSSVVLSCTVSRVNVLGEVCCLDVGSSVEIPT